MTFFIKRPVATCMIFMAVFFLGVYSFSHLPLELIPRVEYPQMEILAYWPGVSPDIVYTRITSPLEECAASLKGIKKMMSESRFGVSRLILDLDDRADMEFAHLSIRESVATIKDVLPYELKLHVSSHIPEEFKREPFLVYTVSGAHSLQKLRELIKSNVEKEIISLSGVAGITVSGGSDPEFRIIMDKERLKALNVHPSLVHSCIQKITAVYPSGKVRTGMENGILRVKSAVSGIKGLGETVIAYSGERAVRLKDVAQIYPSYKGISRINRINGQPTIGLIVFRNKKTNMIKVARAVKKKLKEIQKKLPRDLTFRTVNDESENILRNLRELCLLAGIILSVVFSLVFVFLKGLRSSLLVLSSIVFSVLITLNLVYFLKISLNMLTLGGLALGFGLFVDNAIVVFENLLRWKQNGASPFHAAVQGMKEIFLPVLAATLTTMSVFFSFAYFQGRMKVYYTPLALVIASSLAASLFVSFSLIPTLGLPLLERIEQKGDRISGQLFRKMLRSLLQHPFPVVILVFILFFVSYRGFRSKVVLGDFFGWSFRQVLQVVVDMPAGSPIEITDRIIGKFEERIFSENVSKEVRTTVEPERAWIIIQFPPGVERTPSPWVLKQKLMQLAARFAGIGVGIYGLDPQGYFVSPVGGSVFDSRIKISGYNLKKIREIVSDIEHILRKNPRVRGIKSVSGWHSIARMKSFEYVLRMQHSVIEHCNVDCQHLYSHLQVLSQGYSTAPLRMQIHDREMDISLEFSDSSLHEANSLTEELVQTQAGEYFRLGEVASLEQRPYMDSITRVNQQFQQTVAWEFLGSYRAADEFKRSILSKLSLPPGFSAGVDDSEWMMTEDEKGRIRFAVIFSLVIIFMILASLFESFLQPFIILLAVPLAAIGVFLAFIAARFPFDSSAFIGTVLMAGIVVNNSILLVDSINRKRKEGHPLQEAVLAGTKDRIRPIFLTASTTIMGMLPLVLIQLETGRRHIWSSLALSTLGGLVSSTLLTLLVVPIFYFSIARYYTTVSKSLNALKIP